LLISTGDWLLSGAGRCVLHSSTARPPAKTIAAIAICFRRAATNGQLLTIYLECHNFTLFRPPARRTPETFDCINLQGIS
jgi:hypothetical protein